MNRNIALRGRGFGISKGWAVVMTIFALAISGCCGMGSNKTSWETINDTGDAWVEVSKLGPDGRPLPGIVRSGPGQNYSQITSLANGTGVTITENQKGPDGYWSKVIYNGGEGWMHQDILRKSRQGVTGGGNGKGGLYGAISFNPSSGVTAVSYNNGSSGEANSRAVSNSGGGSVVVAVYNECGAYARASNGANGWGKAQSRGEAETTAMRECNARGAGCAVKGWVCAK